MNVFRTNNFNSMLLRLILSWVAIGFCRVFFFVYNKDIMENIPVDDMFSVFAAFVKFDLASLVYINFIFIILSALPFYYRAKDKYQKLLMFVFLVTNGIAVALNIFDSLYYQFKFSRTTFNDFQYFENVNVGESIFSMSGGIVLGALFLVVILVALYFFGFACIKAESKDRFIRSKGFYYALQTVLMVVVFFLSYLCTGRGFGENSDSLKFSDVSNYTNPQYSSLVLSNPFCVITTIDRMASSTHFVLNEPVEKLYNPIVEMDYKKQINVPQNLSRINEDTTVMVKPNIIFIVIDGLGSSNIKSISSVYDPAKESETPFLDSIFSCGISCERAFQSGRYSVDVLSSVWASIPSYKESFVSIPQSITAYRALPAILKDEGYSTSFFYGSSSVSTSVVSFAQMVGVSQFFFKKEYETRAGLKDYDDTRGIWDEQFLEFAANALGQQKEPFFSTIMTLSATSPYNVPSHISNWSSIKYTDNALRMFFSSIKKRDWFKNTIFVITSASGSTNINKISATAPFNHAVPLCFYSPDMSVIPVLNTNITSSHLDIMPTVLAMIGYNKPIFSFGRDIINRPEVGNFAASYNFGSYNVVSGDKLYQFSDTELIGVYDYEKDVNKQRNLINYQKFDVDLYKAYIQSYYTKIDQRRFTP